MDTLPVRSRRGWLLVLPFFWASPLAGQETTGAIAGTVRSLQETAISPTGVPLATVQVEVRRGDGSVAGTALTTESGAFRIAGLTAGTYSVVFSAPGWQSHTEDGVAVRAGETTTVTIRLTERAYNLNPITVTASKTEEKVLDAPAAVEVVSTRDIEEQPAVTIADHVKSEAAVDVIKTGMQGYYVTVRGFNNIFSGATLTLTDNRIARVPSLRANILHMNPTINADLERIEVVLGPGSALYGPNASNGVIHSITKSPIDAPGGSFSVATGVRQQEVEGQIDVDANGVSAFCTGLEPRFSAFCDPSSETAVHLEGRYAWRMSERFGAKLSGQYFDATEYLFLDANELEQQRIATACLATAPAGTDAIDTRASSCQNFTQGLDLARAGDLETLVESVKNVERGRDNGLGRWSLDARADWRPTEDLSLIFTGGRSQTMSSVDLTGLGAAQVVNWGFTYGQARALYKTWFGQVFFNRSSNDDTYLLQSGRPLIDRSYLLVGQLQNSSTWGARQRFVYGFDALRTVPRSEGTINGVNEEDDETFEVGGYVQSETDLAQGWDLVLAARVDKHSAIDDPVFSPRAAVVFQPSEATSLRLTYNRAFSTPSTLNLFLDISGGSIPVGPFRYDVRATGTTESGLRFRRDENGIPMHMTPFAFLINRGRREFLPTTTEQLWEEMVAVVSASSPETGQMLASLPVPSEQQVPVDLRLLNIDDRAFGDYPTSLANMEDIPQLRPSITNTLEAGYKGIMADRLLLAANGYYTRINDYISAITLNTPNVFLDRAGVESYLTSQGVSPQQARCLAISIGGGVSCATGEEIPGIPLGVVAFEEAGGTDPVMSLTYVNLGDVDLFGADMSATLLISDEWQLQGTLAWVSDDTFTAQRQEGKEEIALNAPTFKWSASARYRNDGLGVNGALGARHVDTFPAASGVYVGTVEGYTVFDLTLGYKLPMLNGVTLQMDIQNLLNDTYRSYPGSPGLGRFSLVRLKYDF